MIAFGHTAVGATVGLEVYHILAPSHPISGLIVAGTAGLISHYITDIIPHGHFFIFSHHYARNIILTILFDFLLSMLIFNGITYLSEGPTLKFWYILFGCGGAQLPDILDNLVHLKLLPKIGLFKVEGHFHTSTHWHGKGNHALVMGKRDIWQVCAVVASLYWIATSLV